MAAIVDTYSHRWQYRIDNTNWGRFYLMSRLIFTFAFMTFFGMISSSGFATDSNLQKTTQTLAAFHSYVSDAAKTDKNLPSAKEWEGQNDQVELFQTEVLVSNRPQKFSDEDFKTLLTMAKHSNALTKLYMNGGDKEVGRTASEKNQNRYQDDVAASVSFSIYAMTNVAQSFVSFLETLPEADRNKPARQAGKTQINTGILNQVLAVTAMSVGDHISEANRLKMVGALEENLPGMSPILTNITLAQIGKNLTIRLLQLKSGSKLEVRLIALEKMVEAMRVDDSRIEVLSN